MIRQHDTQFRVRYSETDAMGYLHHVNYFNYFEVGRVELFRESGGSYRDLEAQGVFLVVVRAECQYRAPARHDDLLTLRTTIKRLTNSRIDHEYQVYRDDVLLAEGLTVLGCVDRDGNPQLLPAELRQ